MCVNPRQIFGIAGPQYIEDGVEADLTILDLDKVWTVDSTKFYSQGHSTLYDGMEVQGEVGAANLVNPYVCRDIIEDLPEVCAELGIERLSDIIGCVE